MKRAHLDVAAVRAFWAERRPNLLAMLDAMEKREHWTPKDLPPELGGLLGENFDLLDRIERVRSDRDQFVQSCVRDLTEALAALPSATATYVLVHVDEDYSGVSYQLLRDSYDGAGESPECNVMWQRAMILARFNLLREVARDVSEGAV